MEGRPAGLGYLYAVRVSVSEAEAYYQEQLQAGGWELASRQSTETGLYGGPVVILDFTRDQSRANVALVFSPTENYTMVLLTMVE